jgi:hypothetical protein
LRLWFTKQRAKVLAPADEEAEKLLAKMQLGECALFEVQRPRSVAWHRMYFGICKTIGENQDPPRDASSIDAELRIRSGHFEVLLFDGLEVRVPKRIAFAGMDGTQWEHFWQRAEQAIIETFGEEYILEGRRAC